MSFIPQVPTYFGVAPQLKIITQLNIRRFKSIVRDMASQIPASNGKTVLISGINGYIASVLGLHLLSKGYSVRGTARKTATTDALVKGPYAPYGDRVQIYEVADMKVSGAFDEAVKGTFPSVITVWTSELITQRRPWSIPHSIAYRLLEDSIR